MSKIDKKYIGLLLGLFVPLAFGALFLYSLNLHFRMPMEQTIHNVLHSPQMLFKFFIVSVTPNLFSIFVAYKKELWGLCGGLFAATLIYFITAIILM